ncbi:hypothetical protein SCANM63S_10311 [Streptomyces canarius]
MWHCTPIPRTPAESPSSTPWRMTRVWTWWCTRSAGRQGNDYRWDNAGSRYVSGPLALQAVADDARLVASRSRVAAESTRGPAAARTGTTSGPYAEGRPSPTRQRPLPEPRRIQPGPGRPHRHAGKSRRGNPLDPGRAGSCRPGRGPVHRRGADGDRRGDRSGDISVLDPRQWQEPAGPSTPRRLRGGRGPASPSRRRRSRGTNCRQGAPATAHDSQTDRHNGFALHVTPPKRCGPARRSNGGARPHHIDRRRPRTEVQELAEHRVGRHGRSRRVRRPGTAQL